MPDNRESILARIVTILESVAEPDAGSGEYAFPYVYRNRTEIAENARPCAALLDGEEETLGADTTRGGVTPIRVVMRPQIMLLLGDKAADVGTRLNRLRASVIHALATDPELSALTANDAKVVYEGGGLVVDNGRLVEGALSLSFALTYVLYPSRILE